MHIVSSTRRGGFLLILLRVIIWNYFAFATLLICANLGWAGIKLGDQGALEGLRARVVARMIEVLSENSWFYPIEVLVKLMIEVPLISMRVLHCCY